MCGTHKTQQIGLESAKQLLGEDAATGMMIIAEISLPSADQSHLFPIQSVSHVAKGNNMGELPVWPTVWASTMQGQSQLCRSSQVGTGQGLVTKTSNPIKKPCPLIKIGLGNWRRNSHKVPQGTPQCLEKIPHQVWCSKKFLGCNLRCHG